MVSKNILSYSKISKLEKCSWQYYIRYDSSYKLRDKGSTGALLGNIVHEFCEILARNQFKYQEYISSLHKFEDFDKKSWIRLIKNKLKKNAIYTEENFEKIKLWIYRFITSDFWFEGSKLLGEPELEFNLKNDKYNIKGYIDRYAIYDDGIDQFAIIRDIKTQKEVFTEKELTLNIQALSYLLAIKQKYPNINLFKSKVEFYLVSQPEMVIQEFQLKTERQLKGFESYLGIIQSKIDNFSEVDAKNGLAALKGYPDKKDGFSGLLICGRASKPGELKKNGELKWHCPIKFPFEYYAALDKDGNLLYSSTEEIKDEGVLVEKRYYPGCPYFFKAKATVSEYEVVEDFYF